MFKRVIQNTIPLLIYSGHDPYPFKAYLDDYFNTIYFRLEEIDPCYIEFSLLYPVDEEGNYTWTEDIPYGLIKTDNSIKISSDALCGIQCLNPKLVNRKIIMIEQKF
jgi:hypothetical protein